MTLNLNTISLNHGDHKSPEEGHCLLEVVSMFAGEPFSDAPACVCPVLRQFGMSWNDGMRSDKEREQLKQYIPRLVGTRGSEELSEKRSWMALDWLIRVHTAEWLSLSPVLAHHADTLRALPQIACTADLTDAQPKLDEAWAAAEAVAGAAVWDATDAQPKLDESWFAAEDAARTAAVEARVAAGAATSHAARHAALYAALYAAEDAAHVAAWDVAVVSAGNAVGEARVAARVAARAAEGVAARQKLDLTVRRLQESAHGLFSAMIDAK